ncbi:MAG: type IVB secretion system apparatus protein IcmL/DotI [Bdellovibrionales bacterium]
MAVKDAIATVLNRNAYYRDGYRLLLRLSAIQLVVIVLLIVGIITVFMMAHTKQVYFATTSDGRIIPIIPLNEPYRSDADVVAWAAGAAKNTMLFDYVNYRTTLQHAHDNYFTAEGWESFNRALKESSILDSLQQYKLIVNLKVNAAPEIANKGNMNGVYTWDLRFPITISYEGNQTPQAMRATLILRIERVSTLQNPEGISIKQWVTLTGTGATR